MWKKCYIALDARQQIILCLNRILGGYLKMVPKRGLTYVGHAMQNAPELIARLHLEKLLIMQHSCLRLKNILRNSKLDNWFGMRLGMEQFYGQIDVIIAEKLLRLMPTMTTTQSPLLFYGYAVNAMLVFTERIRYYNHKGN